MQVTHPKKFGFIFLLGVVVMTMSGCEEGINGPERTPTPDFILTDLEGDEFQLSDTEGKVVVLHFFADWCSICRSEVPTLNQLQEGYEPDSVLVVGVAVMQTDSAAVQEFAEVLGAKYTILYGTQDVALGYGVQSVPVSFIINKEGYIDNRRFSGALSLEQFEQVIDPLL